MNLFKKPHKEPTPEDLTKNINLARKRLEFTKRISQLQNNKINDLTLLLAIQKDEKKTKKLQEKLDKEKLKVEVLKYEIIETLMSSTDLFEIEKDDGTNITREDLNKQDLNDLILYMEQLIKELEDINK